MGFQQRFAQRLAQALKHKPNIPQPSLLNPQPSTPQPLNPQPLNPSIHNLQPTTPQPLNLSTFNLQPPTFNPSTINQVWKYLLEVSKGDRSEEVSLTKKLVDNYWETAERSAKDMHVMIQVRNPRS